MSNETIKPIEHKVIETDVEKNKKQESIKNKHQCIMNSGECTGCVMKKYCYNPEFNQKK